MEHPRRPAGGPADRSAAGKRDARCDARGPFLDTFNRNAATDVDASNNGMSGSRTPALGAGTTWVEGWEGSGTKDSIQVTDSILQMAAGVGMSENGLNHNFIGQDILAAGGFAVSLEILSNRFAGFGGGLNAAQAAGGNDIAAAAPPWQLERPPGR